MEARKSFAINDATMLGEYVGKYPFSFGALDVALKSDHLDARQPAFPIFAKAT